MEIDGAALDAAAADRRLSGVVAIDVLACASPDPFRAVYDVRDARWTGARLVR
jgi:hypothetical protein